MKKILYIDQGTEEWFQIRADADGCASDAPAIFNKSKHETMVDLISRRKTGVEGEKSIYVKRNYARGHETEEKARPIVMRMIGEDLFPCVVVNEIDGLKLLASLDGLTMLEDIIFEHKLYNDELAETIKGGELSPHYYWQLEHQLLVTGAQKVLFVASDGTENNLVHMNYHPVPGRAQELIDRWHQYKKDFVTHVPQPRRQMAKTEIIEQMPPLQIVINGAIEQSNLDEFTRQSMEIIKSINTDLQTDSDFGNAENSVKWLKEMERNSKAMADVVKNQAAAIFSILDVLRNVYEEFRGKRLELEKLVRDKKKEIKEDIVMNGIRQCEQHMAELNKQLGQEFITHYNSDFPTAIRHKRTLDSTESAVAAEVSRVKIHLDKQRDRIQKNLLYLYDETDESYHPLFVDAPLSLYSKSEEDFINYIQASIAQSQQPKTPLEMHEELVNVAAPAYASTSAFVPGVSTYAETAAEQAAKVLVHRRFGEYIPCNDWKVVFVDFDGERGVFEIIPPAPVNIK